MSKDKKDNQTNQTSQFNHKHDIEAKVSFHYSDKSLDNRTEKSYYEWLRAKQEDYTQTRAAYFNRLKKELEQKESRREQEKKEKDLQRQRYLEEKQKVVPLHKKQKAVETKEKSTKFQGRLSKATEVPSPVRGYLKNREKEQDIISEDCQTAQIEKDIVEVEQYPSQRATVIPLFTHANNSTETENNSIELSFEEDHPIEEENRVIYSERHAEKEQNLIPYMEQDEQYAAPLEPKKAASSVSNLEKSKPKQHYQFPSYTLLQQSSPEMSAADTEWVEQQAETLLSTFAHFSLNAELIHVTQGPAVTRFEIQPAPGIKINRFTNLIDDLKLALAAKEIRIEAPIPGKHAIGIEIPNRHARPVFLKDIIGSSAFKDSDSPLVVALGSAIDGEPICTDLQKMPHGLIAGSTGSGKSVCINSILVSLLYKATPEQLRLILIDPKMVELTPYQTIPHLLTPVVTDPKRATAALKWSVQEMERRYQLFADSGVRDLARYNKVMQEQTGEAYTLPYIVIIIDELADLMMVAPGDVEEAICRLTQKARACGIHLLLATQRPSVDVITGLIKSNIPSRIAFAVSSAVDSRTILDSAGAERLLGKGDMLFTANGAPKPIRIQGTFVSDEEIEAVVEHVSKQDEQNFLISSEELKQETVASEETEDELVEEVAFFVMEQGTASTSSIQRRFRIGYNRAARMIDWLEAQGMITSAQGSKPRDVLWSQEYFLEWIDQR